MSDATLLSPTWRMRLGRWLVTIPVLQRLGYRLMLWDVIHRTRNLPILERNTIRRREGAAIAMQFGQTRP